MKVNPPSKTVKGLAEGTLRTTMTHLEIGDVILVMTATADPYDFVKAAPTVAPKRAFWATVATVATAGLVVVAEDGDRIIITDCAPQTAVTIRDRETAVTVEATGFMSAGEAVALLGVVGAAADRAAEDTSTVRGCPTCVMPMMGESHECPQFMLDARAEHLAAVAATERLERRACVTVRSLSKHKSTRLNRRRKQVAA